MESFCTAPLRISPIWRPILIFFVIGQLSSNAVSGICPDGCVCANALIVCTCQGAQSPDLRLQPFNGIEYISKVYVHSCRKLTIPADTFSGLSIGNELSISGIREIHFEPYAFREMQKYPDQITFADSTIPLIPENTFAGLSKAIHLWFRNTSINTIDSYAFRDVSRLDYLYFRESTIKTIKAAAFGYMFHVSHFFIRGRISISHLSDHLFRDSRIGEIVFEDATIQSMDAYALAGSQRFDKFQVSNCTVESMAFPAEQSFPFQATQSGGTLEFMKTNMEHLSLGAFSNIMEVKFYQCRIQELRESKEPLRNVTLLQFSKTLINYVIDRSMAGTSNIKDIVIDECAIDTIYPEAFVGSYQISYLLFLNTRFIKFEKNAFRKLQVGSLILDGCDLETIHSEAFSLVNATETLKVVNSKVRALEIKAFSHAQAGYFGLEHNRIESLHEHALSEITAKEVNISGNYFAANMQNSFTGMHTAYLLLTYNQFACECNEKFAPIFGMANEHVRWGFRANLCTNRYNSTVSMQKFIDNCPQSGVYLKPVALSQNLVCTEMAFLTKCSCASSSSAWELISSETFSKLSPETSQVWIKDCYAIKFHELSFFALKNLAVLKIDTNSIEFFSDSFAYPPNIRVIEFSGAQISEIPRGSFKSLKTLEFLTFTKCEIRDVQSESILGSNINNLSFRETTINKIYSNFVAGQSTIGELSILFSKLGIIEQSALGSTQVSVAKLTIEATHVVSIKDNAIEPELLANAILCFASNNVACHCDNQGTLQLLQNNHCSQPTKKSFCYQPKAAKNKEALVVLMSSLRLGGGNLVQVNGICEGEMILESQFIASQNNAGSIAVVRNLFSYLLCVFIVRHLVCSSV